MELKKVLIVTYYWPPSGGGGVQRWLKLSKYLVAHDLHPIVYTPSNPSFSLQDASLAADVSPMIEVWRRPIWEPYRLLGSAKPQTQQVHDSQVPHTTLWQKGLIFLRANLFVPDPRMGWVRPSVAYLSRAVIAHNISICITTGPPHSMHLIGYGLKKRHPSLGWVADFRDTWTQWEVLRALRPLPMVWRMHERMERRVVQRCDGLLTVSRQWEKEFQTLGARHTRTLYNGFDEADFAVSRSALSAKTFTLLHLGRLNEPHAVAFLAALARICVRAPKLRLRLGGGATQALRLHIQSVPHLAKITEWMEYVPHSEIPTRYAEASVLLLFAERSPSAMGHIPAKFFEYLAAHRPVLAMAPPKGELAQWIHRTKSGEVVPQDDPHAIEQALWRLYTAFEAQTPFAPKGIHAFSRKAQAATLAKWLHDLPA